jgi:hypothetical protein
MVAALAALAATAPAAGASTAKCRTSQLSAKLGQSSGAAGTIVFAVILKSKGATCTLKGFAKLRLLDAAGALPTKVKHGGPAILKQPVKRVTLGPGKKATILVAYEDVPVGNETSCANGTQLAVTPPHDSGVLIVNVGTTACGGGRLWESPVLAGVVQPA